MSYAWIRSYRQALLGNEPLTHRQVAEIVRLDAGIDDADVELARSCTLLDIAYLTRHELRQIIRAELSDEQILHSTAQRVELFARIADLLPAIIGSLGLREDWNLAYAVRVVHSVCADFSIDDPQPKRRDKRLNEIKRKLIEGRRGTEAAMDAIKKTEMLIDVEFSEALEASLTVNTDDIFLDNPPLPRDKSFSDLLVQLDLLLGVFDCRLVDLNENSLEVRRAGGSGKRDVVECAYDLNRVCDGPPLVTTPGSAFSHLCSLIYEMATGKSDESLAGAINRFTKSFDRLEQDAYDAEQQADLTAIQTNDNFHGVKSSARQYRAEADRLSQLAETRGLSEQGQAALAPRVKRSLALAAQVEGSYGPFIVWADQEPPTKREAWRREHREMEDHLRQIDVMLGKLRRGRALGIDPKIVESEQVASTQVPATEP